MIQKRIFSPELFRDPKKSISKVGLQESPRLVTDFRGQCSETNVKRLYRCPLGNPLKQDSHKFELKFKAGFYFLLKSLEFALLAVDGLGLNPWKVNPIDTPLPEVFSWHMNNTNDGESSTTNQTTAELDFYIEPNLKIEPENDGKQFFDQDIDKLQEFFPFQQRYFEQS